MTDRRPVTELTVDELTKVVSDHSTAKLEKAVTDKIDERFIAYGFDTKTPLEIQKDMAFLTKMRKLVDSFVMKTIALIIAGVSVIAILWQSAFKNFMGEK